MSTGSRAPIRRGAQAGGQDMRPQTLTAADGRALGTWVRIAVTDDDPAALATAKAAVDTVLRDVDSTCSRFRKDSELSRLNAGAGRELAVSPLLGRAIAVALRAAELTDGDVDLTVGSAVRRAGYDVDFADIPADGGPITVIARRVPGWRQVVYAPAGRRVHVPEGVEIDLGATAKALAADLAAAAAIEALHGSGGALVSLGGDIAVAGTPPTGGWTIQVSEDSGSALDGVSERIALHGGAVATSSTMVRRWVRGGVEQHHIIDPRTGAPALTPWRLATVIADTCVDANIASTAAIIRGVRAERWLAERALPARLVANDGTVVRVGGWPQPAEVAP
jgi:thiamine biosynthesis lipoprotein ApbE